MVRSLGVLLASALLTLTVGLAGGAPRVYADSVNQGDLIGQICNANNNFGGTHRSCVAFFTAYSDQSAQYAAFCRLYVGIDVGQCVKAFNEIAKGTGP